VPARETPASRRFFLEISGIVVFSSIPSVSVFGVTPFKRAEGDSSSRWARTRMAIAFTSSGVT
jgi:hypothetical protein